MKKSNKKQLWYTVYNFMVSDLHLKSNLASVYAIIHGFTVEGKICNVTYSYLRRCSNIGSNSTISKVLWVLTEAGYITKQEAFDPIANKRICTYKANQVYDYRKQEFISIVDPKTKDEIEGLCAEWEFNHRKS